MATLIDGDNADSFPSKAIFPLPVFSIAQSTDVRIKTLGECLGKNHITYAVLRDPSLLFHNHMPHTLGSAYYLGADSDKLREIAKHEGETLRAVQTVPVQKALSASGWREQLNNKAFTVSFTNYFDKEIKEASGDWKYVVKKYLLHEEQPLIHGLCGGLGHPFIHLAYAYEFDSGEVAAEALSLACTEYDCIHQYFVNPPADMAHYKTQNLYEILARICDDKRFDDYFEEPGFMNTFKIHKMCEHALLEHWNAWMIDNFDAQFAQAWELSVKLAIETGGPSAEYDFFLIHLLTALHAVRIILPHIPGDMWSSVLRQYWAWLIVVYVAQLKRPIHRGEIEIVDLNGRDWDWVTENSVASEWSLDCHYIKVIRALKVGSELYSEKNEWHLKAAVKFMDEFHGWAGFGKGVE